MSPKVRARFDIVAVFGDAETSLRFISDRHRSLDAPYLVSCLRRIADTIEQANARPEAADAVDPHVASTGTPTPRES